jgi:hypothetical protein
MATRKKTASADAPTGRKSAAKSGRKSAAKTADPGIAESPRRGRTDVTARAAATSAANEQATTEQEVVVRGTPLGTRSTGRATTPLIIDPDHPLVQKKGSGYRAVTVKAISSGYYGHKRRRVGEVFNAFVHSKMQELPSWMIYLKDAEPAQDEGTRGLHTGGREDDRIKAEREERVDSKKFKKAVVTDGAENIDDYTIIEDAIPLGEGGNERKPSPAGAQNEKVV